MVRYKFFVSAFLTLVLTVSGCYQQKIEKGPLGGDVIQLWPGVAPGSQGVTDNESMSKNYGVRDVHRPTLTIFLPEKSKNTGTAIVLCPGGGYGGIAMNLEGYSIAKRLNEFGVAGIVLKYRLPRPAGGHVYGDTVPLMDLQHAIRTVRFNAKDWGIDPNQVGVMGSSAGGHLASTAGTHFDKGRLDANDPIERLSSRPDFMVLLYPVISMDDTITHKGTKKNLIGENPSEELVEKYSNEKQVTSETPETFLILANDDKTVSPENSVRFYLALKNSGVPAEMHIFENGGHGFGLGKNKGPVSHWPNLLHDWMQLNNLLKK